MTHGSLFAGIGGFDLGFQWAGIKTLWDVEIDPYCQKVLRKNFPDTEIFSDVKEVGKNNLSPVDIISGGFPCQPWSVAGKQGGTADDRNLWPEMLRVIRELRPRWVVAENVPNLDTMGYLDVAIDDLESIGYEVRPIEIPAAGVGAPHLRRRIWIVAYAQQTRWRSSAKGRDVANRDNTRGQEATGRPQICGQHGEQGVMADTRSMGIHQRRQHGNVGQQGGQSPGVRGDGLSSGERAEGSALANSEGQRLNNGNDSELQRPRPGEINPSASPGSHSRGLEARWWSVEPNIRRVASRVPSRVDRLKGLGNAIVPQIAEIIGRLIVEINSSLER